MSPSVKDGATVAAVPAAKLPAVKPNGDGSVVLPDFRGYTFGEVRDWLHTAVYTLNQMVLVRRFQ